MSQDLIRDTACTVVDKLRSGDVSPLELLDVVEKRVREVDGKVNALPTLCFDRARDNAKALMQKPAGARGLLAGLPVPIKDLTDVAGVLNTQGSPIFKDNIPATSDLMTQDASALAGAVTTAAPNPADYVVLPQTISKEPLGPFTRNGDEVWSDIITWLHYGLIEAEELGVTQANVEEMTKSQTPAIQRLLGASGDLGSRLGLDNKWLVIAIKATGNYGEIYERNVGKASPLKLERGLNGLWSKGGLMYAVPFK